MIPVTKAAANQEPDVEALLAFDRALAAGDDRLRFNAIEPQRAQAMPLFA